MASLTDILKIAGNLEKAEEMAREKSRQDPQFLLDLQLVLSARGKVEESKKLIDELSAKHPEDHRIAFNKGWHLLNEGELQGGMEMLDRGRFVKVFGSSALPHGKPIWAGKNCSGKIVLLHGEGGLGDQIINVRFAKDIAMTGAKVLVSCDKSLQSIFSRVAGVWKTVATEDVKGDMYDEWVPAMSAARVCGFTYGMLPGEAYIEAVKIRSPHHLWRSDFHKNTLKVGIRWSGNPQFEHEQFRKFPVEPMFALADISNIQLFSLQKGGNIKPPKNIIDLEKDLETWEDTAGIIANLDLVITSCTSVAHLAGAMGKETWVIVPIMPYYIWAMPGDKTPWYKSVKIFRQTHENNWDVPLDAVRRALEERAATPAPISTTKPDHITITSKPMKSSQKKTLHFMAGLPRSGSTMLVSLLAQNPDIFGAPVSGLCGIVNGVSANWDKIEFHKETPNETAKINTLRAILENYHAANDRPIIMDKERHWIRHIALLEKVIERPIKIIVPVRPVTEIITSFEMLRQKNPLTFTMVDEQLAERSTLETRAQYFMDANGPVGTCYNYTKDAVISGFRDRLLFVDYNKLMQNPERDLKRIYDFLELPYFKHDLGGIRQLVESDDSVWRYPGLHKVRPTIDRQSKDPLEVLGPEIVARYSRVEPWEQWT